MYKSVSFFLKLNFNRFFCALFVFILFSSYAQNKELPINGEKYQQYKINGDGSAVTDKDVDGNFVIKKEGDYYRKILYRPISLLDFGAKGDGTNDDSFALLAAIKYIVKNNINTIEFGGNYIFNLNGNTIQLPNKVVLKFSGAVIKNGQLKGGNTIISADPVKIFENVELLGVFLNTEQVYVEWFGTYPNDEYSVDLKQSLEKLNKVFFYIKLNQGFYYTKIGNIDLKGITGIGQDKTFIEFQSDKNDQHLFHMGKVGGAVAERSYEYNLLKSVGLVLTAKTKKTYNNSLLVVGASHKAVIEDVKFIANSKNTSLTAAELSNISTDNSKSSLANNAIIFDGSSEAITLDRIFTMSDVGIRFKTYTDFVTVTNYTSWCGLNGLASVYFDDTTNSNVLFSGAQSWCQGLYGLYAKNGTGYNNFINTKFENVRIEQLNTTLKKNKKVVSTSFYFGDYKDFSSFEINNTMLSGGGNGIRIGRVELGKLLLNNINIFYDQKIPRDFALLVDFPVNSNFTVVLKDVFLPPDLKTDLNNGSVVNASLNNSDQKNTFYDSKIISNSMKMKITSN